MIRHPLVIITQNCVGNQRRRRRGETEEFFFLPLNYIEAAEQEDEERNENLNHLIRLIAVSLLRIHRNIHHLTDVHLQLKNFQEWKWNKTKQRINKSGRAISNANLFWFLVIVRYNFRQFGLRHLVFPKAGLWPCNRRAVAGVATLQGLVFISRGLGGFCQFPFIARVAFLVRIQCPCLQPGVILTRVRVVSLAITYRSR